MTFNLLVDVGIFAHFDVKNLVCLYGAGSWLAGRCRCPCVMVWTGVCYWHGVGGFMFNSSSSNDSHTQTTRHFLLLIPFHPPTPFAREN